MVTKIDMDDEFGDTYPSTKFRYDLIRGFRSARARVYKAGL